MSSLTKFLNLLKIKKMAIDKQKLKQELFKRYDIKLSNDDPFWLLMMMQKDMTSEVLSATKTAMKNNKSLGNINTKAIAITAAASLVIGFLLGIAVMTVPKYFSTSISSSFTKKLSVNELKQQNYTFIDGVQDAIIINGKEFQKGEMVYGYKFFKSLPTLRRLVFEPVPMNDEGAMVVINL